MLMRAYLEIILLYILMAAPILFYIGYEIYRVMHQRELNEIQKYMKKVPLKPHLKNAYVECLLIVNKGFSQVYIKERNEKRRLIVLSDNLRIVDDLYYDDMMNLRPSFRSSFNLADEMLDNTQDLIVADWAMIQKMFSLKTTFKDIYKLFKRRNYFTMYAGKELPPNPYVQQKMAPAEEFIEEKPIPVEDIQPVIQLDEPLNDPIKNDERRVDL